MSDQRLRELERQHLADPNDIPTKKALGAARIRLDLCPWCAKSNTWDEQYPRSLCCCKPCWEWVSGHRKSGHTFCTDCPVKEIVRSSDE